MRWFFQSWSWSPPSTHHLGRALDGAQDAHVRPAAALQIGERVLDLGFGGFLLVTQESGGGLDPAVDAVSALRDLLFHIGGLQWVRLFRRAKAREGDHLA